MRKKIVIGNWKMNQNLDEIKSFFKTLKDEKLEDGNFWIAPQIIHISSALDISGNIKIGSQNVSHICDKFERLCSNFDHLCKNLTFFTKKACHRDVRSVTGLLNGV